LFKGIVNDILEKIEKKELDPHNELIGIKVGFGSQGRQQQNLKRDSAAQGAKKSCC